MLAIDDLLAWQRFVIDQPGAANKAFFTDAEANSGN